MDFKHISEGQTSIITQKITEKMINDFAEVTGDRNPIHLNEKYANKTFFKNRIAHGFLYGSFISKLIGTKFPGEGTVYLKQSMNFLYPVYIDDILTIKVEVVDKIPKKKLKLKTIIINENGNIVLEGFALVSLPK